MILLGFWLFATFEYSAFEMWPMVSMQVPYNSSNGIEVFMLGHLRSVFHLAYFESIPSCKVKRHQIIIELVVRMTTTVWLSRLFDLGGN